jgi:hypothetical protein
MAMSFGWSTFTAITTITETSSTVEKHVGASLFASRRFSLFASSTPKKREKYSPHHHLLRSTKLEIGEREKEKILRFQRKFPDSDIRLLRGYHLSRWI